LGIFDNSIIVFTADHGEMMGSHDFKPWMKHTAYTESSNVPFLISYPGIDNNAGKIAKAAITTPDILPSILALSNIDIPNTIEGYDLSHIVKSPNKDSDRVALYMNPVPFGSMYEIDEYRAVRTNKYTYVKTPEGASMLFDDEKDPYQMNNLVNHPEYADIQEKLDQQLMKELHRIGEEKIMNRDYYLKKFGYYGRKEFRPDYHIADYNNVEVVISPNKVIRINEN
jgi:arylsulfatase A-like enzyme